MGLLINFDVSGQVFIVNGVGTLCSKRIVTLERHNAKIVEITDRIVNETDLKTLGRSETGGIVDGVFVVPSKITKVSELRRLFANCHYLRIPLNVCEYPELCTFSLPSTYEDSHFQLGVCTNGMGCRLANRIKRVCLNALPSNMGDICSNIGMLRSKYTEISSEEDEDDAEQSAKFNEIIQESSESRKQKLRWLNQMVEYYPLEKLQTLSEDDLNMEIMDSNIILKTNPNRLPYNKGKISLVGAGPGNVGLLTTEALQDINKADYVLADKLVPEEVLALVPRKTPIFIARKFPGNAEHAQEELLEIGLNQLNQGKYVVRLKQGDPYIYGRGLEEYIYFKKHGFTPKVVAGVTSALSAPLLAQIAPTHRDYADQILICTGTGKAGKLLKAPEYIESRTYIFLMVLHRINEVCELLISSGWNPKVPVAAIERASCPDQRIVRSSLQFISEAIELIGSRPPGLLVVGRACAVVHQLGEAEKWRVEEN